MTKHVNKETNILSFAATNCQLVIEIYHDKPEDTNQKPHIEEHTIQ